MTKVLAGFIPGKQKEQMKLALIRTRINGVTRYKMPASTDDQSIDFVKSHRTESREVIKCKMQESLEDLKRLNHEPRTEVS